MRSAKEVAYIDHELGVLRQVRPERAREIKKGSWRRQNHWVWRLGERIQGTEEAVRKDAELGMFMVCLR